MTFWQAGFWTKTWAILSLVISIGMMGLIHQETFASPRLQETGTPSVSPTMSAPVELREPTHSIDYEQQIRTAAWTADGRRIIAWTEDQITIYDAVTGDLFTTIEANDRFSNVLWTANGTVILGLTRTGNRLVWVVRDVEQPALRMEQFGGRFVTWDGAGNILVTTNVDETQLRIWNTYAGTLVGEIPIGQGAVKVSPNGLYLLMWGDGLELWDLFGQDEPQRQVVVDAERMNVDADWVWSPDSSRFAVMTSRVFTIEIRTLTGEVEHTITFMGSAGGPRLGTMYWSDIGPYIYATIGRGRLEMWNVDTGEEVLTIGQVHAPLQIEWQQVGSEVFLAYRFTRGGPATLEVWNMTQGVQVYVVEGMDYEIGYQLTGVSADMQFAVITSEEGDSVEIWHGPSGQVVTGLALPSSASLRLPLFYTEGEPLIGWHPTDYYYGGIVDSRLLIWDLRDLADYVPIVETEEPQ